ncbi:hypothetical protein QR680_015661 [Steinernema hermaphroditum]|uniref:7TM GPCR serpentine receptor class x (Srx) domain-containing protein n=1 Tax=Steinernema hermaphroditum TaxID=289476 RepID=A0AA39LLA7_9BILA|nr:hypothetical protein QR680_015661 [Steinernema hermaphroditum]
MLNLSDYGHELLGRGYSTVADQQIGIVIIVLSAMQLIFGAFTMYVLAHMSMFHNPFGLFCGIRTGSEMVSSFVHMCYSGPVTILQANNYSLTIPIVMGYVSYFFMSFPCALHIQLSLNRCVAVYFPIAYNTIFSNRNCKYMLVFLAVLVLFLSSLFYVVPCNTMGYSPSLHGYIILGCPDGSPRSIPMGTILNYFCQYALCIVAMTVDAITFVKIFAINRKWDMRENTANALNSRNVRFFAQNAFLNLPMLMHIVFLTISDYSMAESMEVHRILNFLLGRLADFINASTLILFNPEAPRFLKYKL